MRMCKCGKANQPTRKYCIRCGESLIREIEEEKPTAPASIPLVETTPTEILSSEIEGTTDKMSPTTDDTWVRPSEVSTDRVRTADRHIVKTELEKAQEAFEKAESVNIDDRMVKASELRELMAEGPAETYVEERPSPIEVPTPPSPVPLSVPEVTPAPIHQSTPEVPMKIPAPVKTPVTPTLTEVPPATVAEPTIPEESPTTGFSSAIAQPTVMDSDIDKRIQEIDSDITQFTIQLQQFETELDEIRSRNEGDVRWARTVAEQKRIRLEELEDNVRRAKEEFHLSTKDLRNAENRKKKEVSAAEKRVSDLQKRIVNAGKARERRLKEIEKEKAKAN